MFISKGNTVTIITGWWYTYPSEKYESQLGLLFPIYGKIKVMFQTTNQSCFQMKNPADFADQEQRAHVVSEPIASSAAIPWVTPGLEIAFHAIGI